MIARACVDDCPSAQDWLAGTPSSSPSINLVSLDPALRRERQQRRVLQVKDQGKKEEQDEGQKRLGTGAVEPSRMVEGYEGLSSGDQGREERANVEGWSPFLSFVWFVFGFDSRVGSKEVASGDRLSIELTDLLSGWFGLVFFFSCLN